MAGRAKKAMPDATVSIPSIPTVRPTGKAEDFPFEGAGDDVAGLLGIKSTGEIYSISDDAAVNVQQDALDSKNQRQKVVTVARKFTQMLSDRTVMVTAVNEMLRHGLKEMLSQRKEKAKTAEALAKFNAESRVLVADTNNNINAIDYEADQRVGLSNTELQHEKQVIDHRYESLAGFSLFKLGERKTQISNQIAERKKETQPPAWLLKS